jgi:uncharacterized membrane protein YhaH (DUF805 family)
MSIVQERCPACSAPLPIQPGDQRLTCGYCGASLNIERHGHGISVELAQRVIGSIEQNGAQTQVEFRRLRLTQELSSAEMRLANVQSERRAIARGPINPVSRAQLNELQAQELELQQQVTTLQAQLYPNARSAPIIPKQPMQKVSLQRLGWLLLSMDGRANRAEFWAGAVVIFAIYLALVIVLAIIRAIPDGDGALARAGEAILNLIAFMQVLSLIWIGVAVGVKRFHDRDKPGWWVLLALIPLVGAAWLLIELGLLPGTPGANRYG